MIAFLASSFSQVVCFLPKPELLLNLVISRNRALQPWVSIYFFQGESCAGIKLDHSSDQVLQVIADDGNFVEDLPVEGWLIASNETVVFVSYLCLFEWLALGKHHEENHRNGEHICRLSAIRFLCVLLGWHVSKGTLIRIELAVALRSKQWN